MPRNAPADPEAAGSPANHALVHRLNERVKELTALHEAAFVLRDQSLAVDEMLRRIAALVPPAFQYPSITACELRYGTTVARTAGFRSTPWSLTTPFQTADGTPGSLQVTYAEEQPLEQEGPFLVEERRLVDSLAEMLESALDRRAALAALQKSQQRLELALASAGMGIWEWDLTTNRVEWSAELERIAGLGAGSFGGTLDAFRALVHPDDQPIVSAAAQRAFDDPLNPEAFEIEFRLVRPDGRRRWLASNGRVFRDQNGTPVRMLGMAHDVSARKELELQFQQSQKMEAMGRLAGSVAHDFNNILTAIRGYAEFLLESIPRDDERHADVEQISQAADRATSMTQQLLAFSRRQVVAPRILDPNAVIRDLRGMLQRLIRSDIELRVALSTESVSVRMDPGQLEQVIMNLVVNARDAMPMGGTLTIETSAVEFDERVLDQRTDLSPGRYVLLVITDTGTGMTSEVRERLFEPFFTTKEKGRGTGLGLATAYGIVRQAGGAIWVYSEPGRGATFKVYLPWGDPESGPAREAAAPAGSLAGTERVLLVDDESQVRTMAARALARQGYQVTAFATGHEALAWLEDGNRDIDVLVSDIVMPRLQGPEVAARVRAARPAARVLFITGYTERTIDPEELAGARILQKPFTPGGLLRALRELLDGTGRRGEAG